MSYEGYEQMLCSKGHLWQEDAYYFSEETLCPICKGKAVFKHSVDETNGIQLDSNGNPCQDTIPYPFEIQNQEDIWHIDHYGNKYATILPIYKVPNFRKECEEQEHD